MFIKILITALVLFVVVNMVLALRVMLKGGEKPMTHYLARRLMISALVLIVVLLAMSLGYIQPNPRPY
ncbi:DUF2909 domain-containing protein [Agarivorans sp. Toyoura001]|uniref:DUF2909 domain-containing protein n=1 Tax=unclassified Agarivorans TaxID=2636026 RepID=UPI0010DB5111|nr:DUF2909 domain-containing protein [Agarivorans sp. Toyoura001]GDY27682.1 hypothetical protein AHAT_35720 [Agarivorans sp. Toyoura001]